MCPAIIKKGSCDDSTCRYAHKKAQLRKRACIFTKNGATNSPRECISRKQNDASVNANCTDLVKGGQILQKLDLMDILRQHDSGEVDSTEAFTRQTTRAHGMSDAPWSCQISEVCLEEQSAESLPHSLILGSEVGSNNSSSHEMHSPSKLQETDEEHATLR